MMSVTLGRLPHGVMALLVLVAVGLAFLISGSPARADTILGEGRPAVGVPSTGPGRCSSPTPARTGSLSTSPRAQAATPSASYLVRLNPGRLLGGKSADRGTLQLWAIAGACGAPGERRQPASAHRERPNAQYHCL